MENAISSNEKIIIDDFDKIIDLFDEKKTIVFFDLSISEYKIKVAWHSSCKSNQNIMSPVVFQSLNYFDKKNINKLLAKIKKSSCTSNINFIFPTQEATTEFQKLLTELYCSKNKQNLPPNILFHNLEVNKCTLEKANLNP